MAALKPTTIGVPAYRDEAREYLEIAVLHLTLRAGAKPPRLIEFIHRAVPYPVLLLAERDRRRQRLRRPQALVTGRSGKDGPRWRYRRSEPQCRVRRCSRASLLRRPRS